jgi:drug/metabolite transporter (DMT)-like permease
MPRTARAPRIAFLALCLLGALGPLRGEFAPAITSSALPPWLTPALPYVLAALLAAARALLRRLPWLSASQARTGAFIGLGLFAVPTLALRLAQAWIDPFTQVILLALVPVFAVVLEPHIAQPYTPARHALVAALAATAGLLLVFPFLLPRTAAAAAAWLVVLLAVCIVATAYCRAAQLAIQIPSSAIGSFAAVACAASVAAFLIAGIVESAFHLPSAPPHTQLLWSTLIDAPSLLLLFWLLPRLSASRISTRFILSPLFSSLAGLIFLQPALTLRTTLGLVLATGGSAWLLLAPPSGPDLSSASLGLMDEPPR